MEFNPAEPPFSQSLAAHGSPCPHCGVPMAGNQRYCLGCGERRGDARLDPLEAARAPLAEPLAAAALIDENEEALTPEPAASGWEGFPLEGVDFGGPRVLAAAVMGVMVVGVVLGVVAGPKASSTSASVADGQALLAQAPGSSSTSPAAPSLGGDTIGGAVSPSVDTSSAALASGSFGTSATTPVSTPISGGGGG
ncbi:MAG: hypothetical protein WCK97_08855, partial [Actinomycetes bacterium]